MPIMVVLLVFWPAYNLVLAGFVWWFPRAATASDATALVLRFWILIPALNEERVVAATVASALSLDSKRTPVQVLVVDDGSDDSTPEVLAAIHDPRVHVLRRNLPNARLGKGEALNEAYRMIRVDAEQGGYTERCIIGVIDGDGRGTPGMLEIVTSYFADPRVAGVQSRVRIHNRGKLLAFLQDVEFSCVADASQSMRDALGSAELGGNGQFVRLDSLVLLGDRPWSNCLVEDLELGLRLHLHGLSIRYASRAVITQQGLVDVRRMLRQRTRWCQGNFQCFRYVGKLIASPKVKGRALVEFIYYLVSPWFTVPASLLVLGFLGMTVTTATIGDGIDDPASLLLWGLAFFFPGVSWALVHWLRNHDEPLWRTLIVGLIYPLFLFIGIAATWRALVRHLLHRGSWSKTERIVEEVLTLEEGAVA